MTRKILEQLLNAEPSSVLPPVGGWADVRPTAKRRRKLTTELTKAPQDISDSVAGAASFSKPAELAE